MFPQSPTDQFTSHDNFVGQLAALIGIIVEHLVAPDVRWISESDNFYFHFLIMNKDKSTPKAMCFWQILSQRGLICFLLCNSRC